MDSGLPLVAVVGAVDTALFEAWVRHYRALGVERFLIALHFLDDADRDAAAELRDACQRLAAGPAITNVGPWHEHTNGVLRDELRRQAGDGWQLIADADEFQVYPEPIREMADKADAAGTGVVGGLMLDRVADDGALRDWSTETGLDASYPLGGFLTHALLGGDSRKIVLARGGVDIAGGNHRSLTRRPVNRPLVAVHHFKWRAGLRPYLEQRAARFETGEWQEESPAMRVEATRLLNHLRDNGGRIDVRNPEFEFQPACLDELPPNWAARSAELVDNWRPRPYD